MPKLKISAFLLAIAGVSIPAGVHAHFILQAPMNWAQQDGQGLPLKSAPCGQADPSPTPPAVPTNVITPFAPGATVTITINETVPHPGHYRVVLSPTGPSGLLADPVVTPDSQSACGTTTVSAAVYPVLADGMLEHTTPMSGARSFTVKLPTDVTCTKCSLQVTEFMSNHPLNNPGGCWYHHCADISIQTGTGGAGGRGGAGGGAGAGGAAGMAGRGGAGAMAGRGGAGGTGGSAGASGSAGTTGTAGSSGTTGTAGSGVTGTAGTTGTAGASATAGSSGATGAAATGGTTAAGSGGSGGTTVTGRGGNNGTAGSGAAGSGVGAGPPGGGDSSGGCAVGEKNISLSALLLVLVVFASRRRRPRRR